MRTASDAGSNPARRYRPQRTRSWMMDAHSALALAYVWGRRDAGERSLVDPDDFANAYAEAYRVTMMDEDHLLPDVESAYQEWGELRTITLWGEGLFVITEDTIAKAPSYDDEGR